MTALTLPKSLNKLLVVGPIYGRINKLDKIRELLPHYDWIVFNDTCTFSDNNDSAVESQITAMDQLLATGKVIYNVGRIDLGYASQLDVLDPIQSKIEQWIRNKPNVVLVSFDNRFDLVIVSGGIPSHITKHEELLNNNQLSFVHHKHDTYSGGLGHVITNHSNTGYKVYRYSTQIGNDQNQDVVHAVDVDVHGIQHIISI